MLCHLRESGSEGNKNHCDDKLNSLTVRNLRYVHEPQDLIIAMSHQYWLDNYSSPSKLGLSNIQANKTINTIIYIWRLTWLTHFNLENILYLSMVLNSFQIAIGMWYRKPQHKFRCVHRHSEEGSFLGHQWDWNPDLCISTAY